MEDYEVTSRERDGEVNSLQRMESEISLDSTTFNGEIEFRESYKRSIDIIRLRHVALCLIFKMTKKKKRYKT